MKKYKNFIKESNEGLSVAAECFKSLVYYAIEETNKKLKNKTEEIKKENISFEIDINNKHEDDNMFIAFIKSETLSTQAVGTTLEDHIEYVGEAIYNLKILNEVIDKFYNMFDVELLSMVDYNSDNIELGEVSFSSMPKQFLNNNKIIKFASSKKGIDKYNL